MPAHQRMQQQSPVQQQSTSSSPQLNPKAQNIFTRINEDIKALNSSILIISQKIKYLVRNEKILGRNLLVLNKKVKLLQEQGAGAQGSSGSANFEAIAPELEAINQKISNNSEAIAKIQADLDYIKQNYAKSEEVKEIKYVIDSINPLEFATIKDLNELVNEKISAKEKKKK